MNLAVKNLLELSSVVSGPSAMQGRIRANARIKLKIYLKFILTENSKIPGKETFQKYQDVGRLKIDVLGKQYLCGNSMELRHLRFQFENAAIWNPSPGESFVQICPGKIDPQSTMKKMNKPGMLKIEPEICEDGAPRNIVIGKP